MERKSFFPSILLILSLAVLVLVGIGLFLWLDDASRRDARMIFVGLDNAGKRIQSETALEFFVMSGLLTYGMEDASFEAIKKAFPALHGKWLTGTRFPDLIDAVLLVDATGVGPPVSRYVEAERRFVPDATAVSDLLGNLGAPDGTSGSYRIVSYPDALVLVIPVERNMNRADLQEAAAKATKTIHMGRLLVLLNRGYFAERVVAGLFSEYLGSRVGEYSFAVVDDENDELLCSSPDLTKEALDTLVTHGVDRIVPLTAWMGFEDSVLSDLLGGSATGILSLSKWGSSVRIEDLYIRQWFTLTNVRSPNDASGERGSATVRPSEGVDRLQGINLYIWHSAGSIRKAVRLERNRRLAAGYAVLGCFALVALIYYLLYLRARDLRDREHEFVTTVTHELRTPVAAVTAAAENLAEGIVRDPVRVGEYGRAILEHGRRLRSLIDQVLLYAGLAGAQKQRSQTDPVHVDELVPDVASRVNLVPQNRLIVHVQADLLLYSGDSFAVETIITNLLSNAAKHAGETATVTLHVYRGAQRNRPHLVIRVSDTGRGIPRRELGRITAPFYRGEASRAHQIPGSGLGLSLVNRIVRTSRGTLSIDSEVGRGTVVTVGLPFEEARTDEG